MGASGKVIRSSDSTSWTTVSLDSLTTGNIWGIARGGNTWVLVGQGGYISSVSDGESDVTTRTSGTENTFRRVFYKE